MNRTGCGLGALMALVAVLTCSEAAAAESESSYVVVFKTKGPDRIGSAQVDRETDARERALGFDSRHRYESALRGFAARLSPAEAERLRHDPEVALVTPDRKFKALGMVPLAAGEVLPGGLARIGAARAGAVYEASSVSVAVLDTGIDLNHPDLNAQSGVNCVGPGQQAQDDEGHGTEVAGIIGARNNGSGVVGVAPGTRMFAVKVLDATGGGFPSDIICGIDWVTANAGALNIRVANLSLGSPGTGRPCGGDAFHLAVCNSVNAGVVYTAAAGNEAQDFGSGRLEPAAFPEVLAVTAMADSDGVAGGTGGLASCNAVGGATVSEPDDVRWILSGFATAAPDAAHTIAAPGVCVRSTFLNGGYAIDVGTSFAAPHAAGVAALCLGQGGAPGPCAGLSASGVIQKLRSDAAQFATAANGFLGDPLHPVLGRFYGNLVSAEQSTLPPPPPAPVVPVVTRPPVKRAARGCKVPKLRGLKARKARARLRRAHCRYRFRGRGRRVTSTVPRAGKRTKKRVIVRFSRRAKRRAKSGTG